MKKHALLIVLLVTSFFSYAENGYELWLRYQQLTNTALVSSYKQIIKEIQVNGNSSTMQVIKDELNKALPGLLLIKPLYTTSIKTNGTIIIGTPSSSSVIAGLNLDLKKAGDEGYIIVSKTINGKSCTVITANSDKGVLYGVFNFLRLLQTQKPITSLNITSAPLLKLRLLNHWDNPNRTVERGYAGFSIWDWHLLPEYIDQRYIDYARANASVGINGTVLNNVNASASMLTPAYLVKVKALADAFRPYGVKVYLSVRFSSPIELGKLSTADPLSDSVQRWWKEKAKEIYTLIPDFGGFLVKANSEGQPGPQDYKRTHADGANVMADAVAPYNGVIIWRAFVYDAKAIDRHKQGYDEFVPLDGKFKSNVMVQVKNGAIDFQPREPFHPLFGALPKTPVMMEFQLTQEYLGQSSTMVYEAPMFKECLESDTYSNGKGSTVANILDGSVQPHTLTGMAGVSNIGNNMNWCGHPFAQSNWYALGRLAWNHNLSSENIADEWLRMTFTNDATFVNEAKKMMMQSREIVVTYMTPIGLHHIMWTGSHYGPAPWVNNLNRPDWNPVYYHRADSIGLGFNRTTSGTNALEQYFPEVRNKWEKPSTTEEKYLLWFHHIPWDYKMKSGRTMWNELCYKYYTGVDSVKWLQRTWENLKGKVDDERFAHVKMLLAIEEKEADWWRNACVLYFQTFSKRPIPAEYKKPEKTLDYYMQPLFPFAP
ncbi:MAG: alpha-glucuronidase family glycosyl hydrolase [Chitinophagaceae bacterium]